MKARLNWVASSVMYDNNYCLEVTIGNKTFYKTLKGNKVIYFEIKDKKPTFISEISEEYIVNLFIKNEITIFLNKDKNVNIVLNALGLRLATLNKDDREDEPLDEEQTKEHKELKSFFDNLGIEPDFDDDGVVFYVK